jgi:uncharacterized protein YggE
MPEELMSARPVNDHPRRPTSRHAATALAVLALAVGGSALGLALADTQTHSPTATSCSSTTPKLTVVGTGQATARPDVLIATMGVNATANSAAAALNQDNVQVAAAVSALTGGGVARKDIATTGLTLQTQYAYPRGIPTVTGYQASNTITATLHQIDRAGTAIDNVVGAAGNAVQINSLTFSFNNPGAVEDVARTNAVHQAVSHAGAMAQAAGQRLGPVCSLTDQTQTPLQNQPLQADRFAAAATAGTSGSVPLEPGTQSESDQVTLVYALR